MAEILESYDQEFKTTVINIYVDLMGNVDCIQELIRNVSRGIETLRKNQRNAPNEKALI